MAKKIIEFQTHMKNDESFQSHVLNDDTNLWVVDVYTQWCGNCTCAVGTFQKANIRFGGQPIKFGTAISDNIPFLSRYTGTSQPTFMFLAANGTILDVIRGVNVPLINQRMLKLLELEEKIKNGEAERVEFVDKVVLTPLPVESEPEEEEGEEEEDTRPVTVALIKPDAVADGKVDEILVKLEECGIKVLYQLERTLTREDAQTFYEQHQGTDFFLQLVDYMTSGPIVALALAAKSKDTDVVDRWRTLIGPKDVAIAKEEAPESLRAQFSSSGDDNFKNALHGSDSSEQAARELAFFFPDFHKKRTTQPQKQIRVQRTLALIRPDALRKYRGDILEKIKASGFEIANAKEVQLTAEQAAAFYSEHEGQEYFEKLVKHMSSGPVMALALCREDAVTGWRDMLGPKNVDEAKDIAPESLRAQYVEDEEDPALNALHGSDSLESAEREVDFFFPQQNTLAVIKPNTSAEEKELIMQKIRSSGFHIAAQKETVLTQDVAEQFYSEHKEKEFFGELTEFMTSGPTMFMVLSREDAIDGMREIVGPADPEEAKQVAPESIRATVGTDIVKNAIHAPSTVNRAKEEILLAFGEDLHLFDDDGNFKIPEKSEPDDAEIEGAAHGSEEGSEEPASAEAVTDDKEVPGEASAPLPIIIEAAEETETENRETEGGESVQAERESAEEEGEERTVSDETRRFLEEIAKEADEEARAASEDTPAVKDEADKGAGSVDGGPINEESSGTKDEAPEDNAKSELLADAKLDGTGEEKKETEKAVDEPAVSGKSVTVANGGSNKKQ